MEWCFNPELNWHWNKKSGAVIGPTRYVNYFHNWSTPLVQVLIGVVFSSWVVEFHHSCNTCARLFACISPHKYLFNNSHQPWPFFLSMSYIPLQFVQVGMCKRVHVESLPILWTSCQLPAPLCRHYLPFGEAIPSSWVSFHSCSL